MTGSTQALVTALAAARTRASWNERFVHWERPASESEEAIIDRAAGMVRAALAQNAWLASEGVEVRPQGSYHNNTNVRREADMDLCAWHPGIMVWAAEGLSYDAINSQLGYTNTGFQNSGIAARMRLEIRGALGASFGGGNVTQGSKAFTVSGIPGSRADADVVPALRLDYVVERPGATLLSIPTLEAIEGVVIYSTDGRKIFNFPNQHYTNGKAKRARTRHRFKKLVRVLKRMRDELVALGMLRQGQAPSFLIECLVYRVEDNYFMQNEGRYDRIRRVLVRMSEQLASAEFTAGAREINDVKLLFGSHQPWTPSDALQFIAGAWRRLEA